MPSFLKKFFPSVYRKQQANESTNQYCQYDSETLTMFTSSLYLAALLSSLVASRVTRQFGRKLSMFFGGILFLAGALLNGFAQAIWMLIVGRLLLGFGIGFANQVTFHLILIIPFVWIERLVCFLDFLDGSVFVIIIHKFCEHDKKMCCPNQIRISIIPSVNYFTCCLMCLSIKHVLLCVIIITFIVLGLYCALQICFPMVSFP